MKINKLGHCCLLIEVKGKRILTDPGNFSTEQNNLNEIDVVLITHEHADHFHIDSLKQIMVNNPKIRVFTNSGVGKILDSENIKYELIRNRDSVEIDGVKIEAFDNKHEEIFEELGQVQNTGYFIAEQLFYPGDSYCDPEKSIDTLALPVAGPWCKIPDAIRYALKLKPKKVFPVHDGMLEKNRIGASHKIPEKVLSENGIEFISLLEGDEKEF